MESILSQLKNCMVFLRIIPVKKWTKCTESCIIQSQRKKYRLLFTPVSITPLIDTEDACFDLNASRPIAKGDLKWRDALLVAHRVNSNKTGERI